MSELPTSVWSRSLERFRQDTAANRPTPGCGAVAAVSASLGLALVLKALRISQTRQEDPRRLRLIEPVETLLKRLGSFADDDMQAFSRYLQAARQSDDTSGDDVQAAARQACAVPLATAHACLEALGLSVSALSLAVDVVRADIEAGALLIHSALSAALLNVDADLPCLAGHDSREQARAMRQRLQADADAALQRLRGGASRGRGMTSR
ncbi:cyclodeaminase/cyclohydrolase family protein [Stutzerimonas azotifigens]|uniref:cyclodeaminase/cyclohydrolase family protein n=1 Tax=Stutzerimonas azotifigens TaxID=291995 RepID=UPI0021599934|nr:cyclodeaminase/cyclohydrolase family protein [Stutzerimonas azotifigens]